MQPRLTIALVASAAVHALLTLGAGAIRWPAPPIPIEIIRTSQARAPVGEAITRGVADEKPEPPKPEEKKPDAPKGPGPQRRPPTARPAGPPTARALQTTDLSRLGPEQTSLRVLLKTDKLRESPWKSGVEALLRALPDARSLLGGTRLSMFGDFDTVLITTSDPLDVYATFLAARYHDERVHEILAGRSMPARDPRKISFPATGLAVLAAPQMSKEADVDWATQLRHLDKVASSPSAPAVLAQVGSLRSLVRLGAGLPTPESATLAMTADRFPRVRLQIRCASEDDALALAAAWPEVLGRWRAMTMFLGLAGALDGLRLERKGAGLDIAGQLEERHVRTAMVFVQSMLPPSESLESNDSR